MTNTVTISGQERDAAAFLAHGLTIGSGFFLGSLRALVLATGVAKVAERSGLNRESLYKAIALGAQPRFETVAKILAALDLEFTIKPKA